jgi:RNA polymerase sigma-70 factor, ECF subfamily
MEKTFILEAKKGNNRAFTLLIKDYMPRIYRTAYLFMKNRDDASDITQEVCLKAYKNMDTFDENRPLYPWLYRITKNLCLNQLQTKKHKEFELPEEALIPGTFHTPDRIMEEKEANEKIKQALDALKPNYREIIMLKHFHDCSYAEIADILDIPIGTVMSRLYNARTSLKRLLFKEDFDEL